MRNLTEKEKQFFEDLLRLKPQKQENGYYRYAKTIKGKVKNYKRSRVLMQLHLNKKLDFWDVVHHKDGDKGNDQLENLEVIEFSVHNSNHHAGRRKN